MTCGGGVCEFAVVTRTPRQHFLNFFPLPHGHCSFLSVLGLRLIANLSGQTKSESVLYAEGRREETSVTDRSQHRNGPAQRFDKLDPITVDFTCVRWLGNCAGYSLGTVQKFRDLWHKQVLTETVGDSRMTE